MTFELEYSRDAAGGLLRLAQGASGCGIGDCGKRGRKRRQGLFGNKLKIIDDLSLFNVLTCCKIWDYIAPGVKVTQGEAVFMYESAFMR
jgi:hypothetical protein